MFLTKSNVYIKKPRRTSSVSRKYSLSWPHSEGSRIQKRISGMNDRDPTIYLPRPSVSFVPFPSIPRSSMGQSPRVSAKGSSPITCSPTGKDGSSQALGCSFPSHTVLPLPQLLCKCTFSQLKGGSTACSQQH